MGCLLDDLRASGINVDQWTTAAQNEGGWRKTTKWIAAEKARTGLRHTKMKMPNGCSSMPEHDGKYQGEDSPKQACSCCWFARHS